ncbi:isopeptide-forming domain-containing fimbrial protein [Bifidobacterium dentium]|uniref:isopeptide-forming domain-containing fimbrial protein n=1 Tax=Bifidobacterium dentium TaxID=1689 RepID=UPI003D1703C0
MAGCRRLRTWATTSRSSSRVPWASNYASYKTYYFAFHDVEERGLTFNKDSVKVYVDDTEIAGGYSVVTEGLADGCTFEVKFADLKRISAVKAGSRIRVEYTSKLNENAVIGEQWQREQGQAAVFQQPER